MSTLQEQIDSIKSRYQPQLEELKRRGEALRDKCGKPDDIEAVLGVDFTLEMVRTDVSFDLPSITMKEQHIALDVPEVFSERQTIIFHTPSVRMVPKVVGRYPEFHWPNVIWKDIIIDVPEPFMEEHTIVFDTPSVSMKRQDWYLKIPEFTMERIDWSFDVPKLTIANIKGQLNAVEEEGERLKAEGERIAGAMKAEIMMIVGGIKAVAAQEGHQTSNQVTSAYDAAIAKLQGAIDELLAKGIDPIKVPGPSGDQNLRKQLANLIEARAAALENFPASPTP